MRDFLVMKMDDEVQVSPFLTPPPVASNSSPLVCLRVLCSPLHWQCPCSWFSHEFLVQLYQQYLSLDSEKKGMLSPVSEERRIRRLVVPPCLTRHRHEAATVTRQRSVACTIIPLTHNCPPHACHLHPCSTTFRDSWMWTNRRYSSPPRRSLASSRSTFVTSRWRSTTSPS